MTRSSQRRKRHVYASVGKAKGSGFTGVTPFFQSLGMETFHSFLVFIYAISGQAVNASRRGFHKGGFHDVADTIYYNTIQLDTI